MPIHDHIISALADSGSTIDPSTVESALELLSDGGSLVVAGTWASGRPELARALAAAAGRACVSTLYCDTPGVDAEAGVVCESVRPLRSAEELNGAAVRGSDWAALAGRPATIKAMICLSGTRWVLDTV